MANATKEKVAPLKNEGLTLTKEDVILEELGVELDPKKKYVFELAAQNSERELPVFFSSDGKNFRALSQQRFKPYQNIILTSQIVWKNQRVNIRYYDVCDTIFTSEQPKDKDVIDDFIKRTKKRAFLEGYFGAYGDEKMLLAFMFACSWNADSPYRTRTADVVFISTNIEKKMSSEASILDEMEKAIVNAKEASETKMRIHCSYLGIPDIDYVSGNELSPAALRIVYRKKAMEIPKEFNQSYGNQKLELKYFIDQALLSGLIDVKSNPNKAKWKSGTEICDISGLRSQAAIAEKLLEFSQFDEGDEFSIQLKAVYSS